MPKLILIISFVIMILTGITIIIIIRIFTTTVIIIVIGTLIITTIMNIIIITIMLSSLVARVRPAIPVRCKGSPCGLPDRRRNCIRRRVAR